MHFFNVCFDCAVVLVSVQSYSTAYRQFLQIFQQKALQITMLVALKSIFW